MSGKDRISQFSKNLFWDVDMSQADIDKAPGQIIQLVLEYGEWNDWRLVLKVGSKNYVELDFEFVRVDFCK